MPVQRDFDFRLDGRGYMLSRATQMRGRAWQRTGSPDAPDRRELRFLEGGTALADFRYGVLPDSLDHPEVWDDWSGGFGDAYRDPEAPNRYHWSENFDARFPRQLVHAQTLVAFEGTPAFGAVESIADAPPTGSIQYPGAGGVVILERDNGINHFARASVWAPTGTGSDPWDLTNYILSGANADSWAHRPAIFGSFIYVPRLNPAAGFGYLGFDSSGSLAGGAGSLPGMRFAVAGNRLWRAHGPTRGLAIWLQSIADMSVTAVLTPTGWSATLNVGNGANSIKDMVALDDQLYCAMPNGLYAGDQSGTFVNVLPEMASQIHPDNGHDLTIHNHRVIYPHISGLFAYDNGSLGQAVQIGPQGHSNTSPIHGYVRTVTSFGQWLVGGYYAGSYSYILAGYDANGNGGYIWHPLQRLPLAARVHRVHFDGITSSSGGTQLPNRFYVATDGSAVNGDSRLYYHLVPFGHNNPLLTDFGFSANYCGSARMDLGYADWGMPSTPKVFRSVDVWADNLDDQHWGLLYYTVDGGARTLLGTVNTSPKTTVYFPTTMSGGFVTGQTAALSLESYIASGHTATTPIYRAIVLRGAIRPRSIDMITAVVDVADETVNRMGTPMRPGASQLQELRDLAVQAAPVQLVDLAGATSWVQVLAPVEEMEVYQEGNRNPYLAATVKLAVLSFS